MTSGRRCRCRSQLSFVDASCSSGRNKCSWDAYKGLHELINSFSTMGNNFWIYNFIVFHLTICLAGSQATTELRLHDFTPEAEFREFRLVDNPQILKRLSKKYDVMKANQRNIGYRCNRSVYQELRKHWPIMNVLGGAFGWDLARRRWNICVGLFYIYGCCLDQLAGKKALLGMEDSYHV